MAAKWRKAVAVMLAAVCAATMFMTAPASVPVHAAAQLMGHDLIAENSAYALYMQEEDLSVILQDKATGMYMESAVSYDDGKNNETWMGAMRSAVVLNLIYSSMDTLQADLVNDEVRKEITYTDNGFEASLYWTKYKVGITLKVSLNEDGFTVCVPDESIVEDGTEYYIGTISLYPYMGWSYLDDKEGYMLIPDGNGALIYLDDKDGRFNSGYSGMIYGSDNGFADSEVISLLWDKYEMVNDANKVIAPVYGMAFTDDGIAYLAVVEEGAQRASIEANPNGVNVDYNRIYAKFTERRLYTQPTSNNSTSGSFKMVETDRSHSDLTVRFLFLSQGEANYCGMANAYRNYLIARGDLTLKEDSYRTRLDFLGTDREKWVIGTSAIVMTTVEDIREIYKDLETSGVTELFSVYKGWQKGGLYNVPINSLKADSAIGGTKELAALMKEAAEADIQFYLYSDALRINPDEKNATFNVIKKVNKKKFVEETYKDVYEEFLYLTPARSNTMLNGLANSCAKKGIANLAVAGITNTLFSYSYSGTYYSRFECADSYRQTLETLSADNALVLEQPFAYLWENTDAFLDMPLYPSSYIYEDESVPFLSIVLKGVMPVYSEYVNFEANKQEFFLKLVETGTYPSFYLTMENSADLIYTNSCDIYSSQYSVYRDTILEYAEALGALNEKVQGAFITGHEIRDNKITVVTYDNGVKVYLNYGDTAAQADGCTIEAMSYKVVE